jgi:probable phosphoglycerate mutase
MARHGKPDTDDRIKRYTGRTDVPLSAEGAAQADAMGRRLAGKGIAVIYTSPLVRCKDFAQGVAAKLGLPRPLVLEDLAELNLGTWENRPVEEIKARYPGEYEARGGNLGEYRTPGGESFAQCQERALRALRAIAQGGADALVISHAGVIRSALCYIDRRDLGDLFSYQIPYSALFTLDYEGGIFRSS